MVAGWCWLLGCVLYLGWAVLGWVDAPGDGTKVCEVVAALIFLWGCVLMVRNSCGRGLKAPSTLPDDRQPGGAQGADRSYPTPNTLQPLGSLPWPRKLPPVPPKTKSLSPHRYPAAMLAFMAALMDPPRKLTFLERYCTSNRQLAMTQLFNLGMLVYVAEGRTAG